MTPSIVYSAPAPAMADFKTPSVKQSSDSERSRGLAGMLLAAAVAALVVVADQLVSTWADGHLFLAWVAMWAVVFASMAVFTGAARRLSQRLVRALDAWAQRVTQLLQRITYRRPYRFGVGRWLDTKTVAPKQVVADRFSQTFQGVAHGWLGHGQPQTGTGETSLNHHLVEDAEQIEI